MNLAYKIAKSAIVLGVLVLGASLFVAPAQQPANLNGPRFLADGRLERPRNYREWTWLSSGLGMSYSQGQANPNFDNVFVTPEAYRAFIKTGRWPDHTMFALEVRASQSKGSINQQGHYQGALAGIEVEVKDERRFPGKWAFFDFHDLPEAAAPIPQSVNCYSCHSRNGAVDNTFVQFYPTLAEVAKQKGTFRESATER
jgi:Cytochrome P460